MKTRYISGLTPPANAGPPAWLLERLAADFRHGRTFICSRCGILTPDEFCEGHAGSPLRSPICRRCVNHDVPPPPAPSAFRDPHSHNAGDLAFPVLTALLATNARARALKLRKRRLSRGRKSEPPVKS